MQSKGFSCLCEMNDVIVSTALTDMYCKLGSKEALAVNYVENKLANKEGSVLDLLFWDMMNHKYAPSFLLSLTSFPVLFGWIYYLAGL
ncbi:hypothetical protein ACJX0J_028565, partial [Zea mays]